MISGSLQFCLSLLCLSCVVGLHPCFARGLNESWQQVQEQIDSAKKTAPANTDWAMVDQLRASGQQKKADELDEQARSVLRGSKESLAQHGDDNTTLRAQGFLLRQTRPYPPKSALLASKICLTELPN